MFRNIISDAKPKKDEVDVNMVLAVATRN